MSYQLSQFLIDAYDYRHVNPSIQKKGINLPIQIDDQDDNDKLDEFCNIYVTVKPKNIIKLELIGNFPLTKELVDLSTNFNGFADPLQSKLVIYLKADQIDVIMDIADKIRKTSFLGPVISNPNWLTISSRTISSLYRFARIIKEYKASKK
jgi:hypothetical protein